MYDYLLDTLLGVCRYIHIYMYVSILFTHTFVFIKNSYFLPNINGV